MKRIFSVLLVVFLLVIYVLPMSATVATPFDASVAMAQAATAAAVGVDTPGAAVVLVRNGAVLMADGFGYADLSSRVLVTADTVFEIGELSGLLAAVAALTLVDSGKLSLDADIATYLPAEFMTKLALSHPVTLGQLLSGHAGFGGRIFDVSFDKESHTFETLEEALLADVPEQIMMPGTAYSYSTFGIALAAFVVEQVAGVEYGAYLKDHVLAPLGMKDTVPAFSAEADLGAYATGYTKAAEGSFMAPQNGGRSFAGLYPATGALSCAADLSRLLAWLVSDSEMLMQASTKDLLFTTYYSGIFASGALGLSKQGTAYTCHAKTACFGASLCIDTEKREAALVLTNAPQSTLLDFPLTVLEPGAPALTLPVGEMVELKALRGTYAAATSEQHTFVGQFFTMQENITAAVNEDGTLSFLDMRLTQIAPGVFADAAGDTNMPVLQFLLDGEGEVTAVVTADGACYYKLPFYYARVPATFLFGVLLLLAAGFALMGLFGLLEWLGEKNKDGERASIWFVLPGLLAALLGILVGVQVLAAYKTGAAMLSSFYFAMRVLALLVGIGATVSYVVAFVSSVLDRKQHKRIAYSAILYLVFVFLICFFNLTVI
ncbi:MAG: beta-lactamase family protein [Ruminococcaceae bacterium]|nr:beta-lactamase family protein [Oscillospiraceae bacterium]